MKRRPKPRALFAPPSRYTLVILAIFVVGLALRLYALGSESLWWDEVYAISRMAHPGPLEIIRLSSTDNNPPLFYLLLHYWMPLAGDSAFSVRLPSAIAGALTVLVMYRIGTLLFDRSAGLLAALVLALSAYHLRYAQEARAYGLMVFLTLLSFYFFVRLIKDGGSRYTSIGYVICTALLMYTHFYGVFFVAAQIIYVLVSRENLRRWIVLGVALLLLYVPWVVLLAITVLSPEGAWRSGTTWIPDPTLLDVTQIFQAYSGSVPLTTLYALLAGYGLFNMIRGDRSATYLLLPWLLVPIAVPILVSHFYRPMLADRFTIAASPAFYLLITQGFAGLKRLAPRERRYAQALLVGVVTALSLASITGYYSAVTKQPWKDVAAYVDENARAGDVVIFYWAGGLLPFDYYSERPNIEREPFVVSDNASIWKTTSTAVRGHDRVWLVMVWESGQAKKALPRRLTRLYGKATYNEVYAVTDTYNSEVATVPYQGDGIDVLLFEGVRTDRGRSK